MSHFHTTSYTKIIQNHPNNFKMSFSPGRMSKSKCHSVFSLTKGLLPTPLTQGCLEEHAKPRGGRDATVRAWSGVRSSKASEYTNLQFNRSVSLIIRSHHIPDTVKSFLCTSYLLNSYFPGGIFSTNVVPWLVASICSWFEVCHTCASIALGT